VSSSCDIFTSTSARSIDTGDLDIIGTKWTCPSFHTDTNFETSSLYSSFHCQYTFRVTSGRLNESNKKLRTHHREIYLLGNVARYYWDIYRRRLSDGLDTKLRTAKLFIFSKKFSIYFKICSSASDNWINMCVSCRGTPSCNIRRATCSIPDLI